MVGQSGSRPMRPLLPGARSWFVRSCDTFGPWAATLASTPDKISLHSEAEPSRHLPKNLVELTNNPSDEVAIREGSCFGGVAMKRYTVLFASIVPHAMFSTERVWRITGRTRCVA